MGATTIAGRVKTWIAEVLTFSALNAEFDNAINEINSINNAKFTSDAGGRLSTTKIAQGAVALNAFLRTEHSAVGGHEAFTAKNMDTLYVKKNAGTPDSKVDIVFNRATVYDSNGDNPSIRLKKEVSSTGPVLVTADITVVGANGRESGSTEGGAEWWYVWLIYNHTAGTAAAFLSPFATFATITLPTDYAFALLAGRIFNDADLNFDKPEASVGANAEKYVVPFDAEHDYSVDGYHMFGSRDAGSDGPFMIQWGEVAVGASTFVVVNLPKAYRQTHMLAMATRSTLYANQAQIESWYAEAASLTQITIVNSAPSGVTFHWLSMGI